MDFSEQIRQDYKNSILFFIALSACVVLAHWLSRSIPVVLYEDVLASLQNGATTAVCFFGAWLLFRHSEGLRIRKAFGYALMAWGVAETILLLQTFVFHIPVFKNGTEMLNLNGLFVSNILGWLLLVYPTETLRPRWMTWKHALWQLLPMVLLVALDYVVPADLRILVSLYPVVLFVLVLTHIRAYRIWCEDNYSSMDHIDVQWILRYLLMLLVVGLSYLYICLTDHPVRALTQNLLLLFMFGYSIEQILFRHDPWEMVRQAQTESCPPQMVEPSHLESSNAAFRATLEEWMEREKPYLNPDFRLMDLSQVLPMNRTYLSQLIHAEYGCTFYQFVNRYRIEEAKRLKLENPDMKVREVADRCGFSSPTVFSRTFSTVTGMTPREWAKKIHSA